MSSLFPKHVQILKRIVKSPDTSLEMKYHAQELLNEIAIIGLRSVEANKKSIDLFKLMELFDSKQETKEERGEPY